MRTMTESEQRCGECQHLDKHNACDAPVSRFVESELPMCYSRRLMWETDIADDCPYFERKEPK